LREADITAIAESLPQYDVVVASGVFNAELVAGDNRAHISEALSGECAGGPRHYVAVDFLSTFVDFSKTRGMGTQIPHGH